MDRSLFIDVELIETVFVHSTNTVGSVKYIWLHENKNGLKKYI